MQVAEQSKRRAGISVSAKVKSDLMSLKVGNETYNDILEPIVSSIAQNNTENELGVIFLDSVYINDKLVALKKRIPLKIILDENKSVILVNDDYNILSVCSNLDEGLEEARREFEAMYSIYTEPSLPQDSPAARYGHKLKSILNMPGIE